MKHHPLRNPATGCLAAALALVLAPTVAPAQGASGGGSSPGDESAFDAYTMFEESEGPDWVGANDRVGEIGGWKTYAREMHESASEDALDDAAESGEGEDE